MCKTKFLQMYSFSITLTSLHSLNLNLYLDSLRRRPNFPHFAHFHPDFRPRF